MPTELNISEIATLWPELLSNVEGNHMSFTIMRAGKPIAQISPVVKYRDLSPDPVLVGEVRGDLFEDESDLWEVERDGADA